MSDATPLPPRRTTRATDTPRPVFGSGLAWYIVIGAALALSWWSLYSIALYYKTPAALAMVASTVFDGAALITGELTLDAASRGDGAFGERAMMLGAIGLSGWLNWEHGVLIGAGVPGRVLFAATPVMAGALAWRRTRAERREALRAQGRIAPALPPFGLLVIALHPRLFYKRVRQITGSRLASIPLDVMDYSTPDYNGPDQDENNGLDEEYQRLLDTADIDSETDVPNGDRAPRTGRQARSSSPSPQRKVPLDVHMGPARRLCPPGEVPSINRLMRELHVGHGKARQIHERLATEAQTSRRLSSAGEGLGTALGMLVGAAI